MNSPQKKRGLGRGLDALLSGDEAKADAPPERVHTLAVHLLQAGKYQPRTRMDPAALTELAESIKVQGVIQPVLVRRIDAERYEIIAGERRVRAARLAGLAEVPVVIREVADSVAAAMALIENIQREDLNPLEEAQGLQRLIDDFSYSQEQAAQAVGRSRSAVANLLRLLALPAPLQEMLHAGEIDMGHARALLALRGQPQLELARHAANEGLSVRAVEELVRQLIDPPAHTPTVKKAESRSRDLLRLEEDLSEKLGTKVEIAATKKGGRLVIHYSSNDHLEDLLARLQ